MTEADFTLSGYQRMILSLLKTGYIIIPFKNAKTCAEPKVILRHDVDVSPQKAVRMAELECSLGVKSTYFFLLSSPLYNVLDADNERALFRILDLGHEVGLHFDVSKYDYQTIDGLKGPIKREIAVLEAVTGKNVSSMSWHIPKKEFLSRKLPFLDDMGVLNAYDPEFFEGYDYYSDSTMRWRRQIAEAAGPRLQVLTHPIWYTDNPGTNSERIIIKEFAEKQATCLQNLDCIRPGIIELLRGAD